MELYTPNNYVEQADMEKHDGCVGKYTTGLLQSQIGFCGEDEDAVSFALTVTRKLFERIKRGSFDRQLGPNILSRIGRLEVTNLNCIILMGKNCRK